jgi:aconitate hydratase
MDRNVAQQLVEAHLVSGDMVPGQEVALRVDQTLTQDATGTMVMLELEALGLDRAHTEVSVQYVDHNLLQADERNAEDHLFSARPPAASACGSPSRVTESPMPRTCSATASPARRCWARTHTCAVGSLGMLAVGVGGLEVALAIAGKPLYIQMPQIWGVRLIGELPRGARRRT